jgi:hypothetical protein
MSVHRRLLEMFVHDLPHLAAHVQVCKHLHPHHVATLGETSARQFFRQRAGLHGDPEAAVLHLEAAILAACGGLPLALRLMGGQLNGKRDEASWKVLLFSCMYACLRGRYVGPHLHRYSEQLL